jgi:REP element-mobilizing transposase RayT
MLMEFDPRRRIVHAICTLHGHWLPGDERGFRARDHRIHSSGDYKELPPIEEHSGLRQYAARRLKHPPITLTPGQRTAVGGAFFDKLRSMGCEVAAISCAATHLHSLHTPAAADALRELGRAKQFASLKCPDHKGQLWGEGGKIIAVRDADHFANVLRYILNHARTESAWVWQSTGSRV